MTRSLLNRYPNEVQLPLVIVGYQLAIVYALRVRSLTQELDPLPVDAISAELYDWSTVLLGLGLVVLGLSLSNRSVFHRHRVLRLPRRQRLVALGCALLLVSPWLTTVVAGLVLGYRDPFSTLWSIAFLGGFVGVGGILLVGISRVAQVYGTWADRVPYVGINMSRREAIRGRIVTLTAGLAIAIILAAVFYP